MDRGVHRGFGVRTLGGVKSSSSGRVDKVFIRWTIFALCFKKVVVVETGKLFSGPGPGNNSGVGGGVEVTGLYEEVVRASFI